MKVKIESLVEEGKYGNFELTRVYVDDILIGEGSYGGEPEDNSRLRDYRWVENMLAKLSEKLGAEVEIKKVRITDE